MSCHGPTTTNGKTHFCLVLNALLPDAKIYVSLFVGQYLSINGQIDYRLVSVLVVR
jgi:hypothetical protein